MSHQTISLIALPGSPLGPCIGKCLHVRCQHARRIAGLPCPVCREAIGYFPFTDQITDKGRRIYLHADCLADHLLKHGSQTAQRLIEDVNRAAECLADGADKSAVLIDLAASVGRAEKSLRI